MNDTVKTHIIALNDDQIHELRIGLSMRRESLKRRMTQFTAARLADLDAINDLLSI